MRHLIALTLTLLVPSTALAWGNTGHRVVATIAQQNLNDDAAAEVTRLLAGKTLTDVATRADQIRNQRPETKPWHFVDIPVSRNFEAQDCTNHDCVIDQINAAKTTLADRTKPDGDRAEALMFLTHFVGDLHQPLHCSTRIVHGKSDRGGNDLSVHFFGDSANLHSVFDSRVIEQEELSETDLVDFLTGDVLAGRDPNTLASGSVDDWARDAHNLGKQVYADTLAAHAKLNQKYFDKYSKKVDDQLLFAGLRLARLINEALSAA